MRKALFATCFLTVSLALFSQKKLYLKSFEEGNYLFLEKNYAMALQSFELAYSVDSTNANINYKMGMCYLNLPSKKKKALRFMEKAARNITKNYDEDDASEKMAPIEAIYEHAKALHFNGQFQDAIPEFEKYGRMVNARDKERQEEVARQIEMCRNAIELYKKPADITIKNLGDSINTEFPDYGPVVNADESMMLFTSRRPGSTGGERGIDGSYYEDIYISHRKPDGSWSASQKLFSLINTNSNEATIGLSPDGQKVYIYKDSNGGDLYYSTLTGETWSGLTPFGDEINSPHWETHISISADGNTLFFSSDRPGGLGGTDLYRCVRLPNGKWSKPLNLGPKINTKYDEDAPYLHPDGKKLFFSSEGHNSMGGLDIMYSDISTDENGNLTWSEPANIGVPLNTPDDDEFYVPSVDGKHAYFSSAREGGLGDHDIYVADLPKGINVEPLVLLKGTLEFNGEHQRPEKVAISVFDENGELVAAATPNFTTGKFLLILNPGPNGKKYKVNYEATGFQPISHNIDVAPGSAYQVVEHEIDFDFINMESKTAGTVSLSGTIKNEKGAFIPGVQINVKDNNTGQLMHTYTTSSDSGFYYFVADRGKNYNVSFEATGYLFQSYNIDIPKKSDYVELKKNIVLEKIHEGAKMVMNNIFFDKNKSVLRKQSMVELATIYKMLKENPDMVIEISGHTDNAGNDKLNQKLSLARAQSVVNYLTKKGISKKQLIAKGYGKSQPIAPNTLPNGKPDLAGMQLNRRVEMKIVEATK